MTNLFTLDHPGRSALWDEVMTRAGDRCEYTTLKRRQTSRCEHEAPGVALVVAPRDPAVSEVAAWRVPVAELAAWCTPCLTLARRTAANRSARRAAVMPGQLDLIPSGLSDPSGKTVATDGKGVTNNE